MMPRCIHLALVKTPAQHAIGDAPPYRSVLQRTRRRLSGRVSAAGEGTLPSSGNRNGRERHEEVKEGLIDRQDPRSQSDPAANSASEGVAKVKSAAPAKGSGTTAGSEKQGYQAADVRQRKASVKQPNAEQTGKKEHFPSRQLQTPLGQQSSAADWGPAEDGPDVAGMLTRRHHSSQMTPHKCLILYKNFNTIGLS